MNLPCCHLFYYPQFSGNREISSILILKWWGLLEPQKQCSGWKIFSKKLGFDKYTCDKLHLQGEIIEFHLVSSRDCFKDQKHFKYACLRKFLKQFLLPYSSGPMLLAYGGFDLANSHWKAITSQLEKVPEANVLIYFF